MQGGAPVLPAGRKLERVSNGAPRGMAATFRAPQGARNAQNPAYRPALPLEPKKPTSFDVGSIRRARRGAPASLSEARQIQCHFPRGDAFREPEGGLLLNEVRLSHVALVNVHPAP